MIDQASELRRLIAETSRDDQKSIAVAELPPSVPTGRVSFGPDPRAGTAAHVVAADQTVVTESPRVAASKARITETQDSERSSQNSELTNQDFRPAPRLARAIVVASGKGGVGKSNVAVNLSIVLAAMGRRTCLIDADLGMANADLLCNLTPRYTLDDIVHGRCRLGDALLQAPGGFRLLPGAAGIARMAGLAPGVHERLIRRLSVLERAMDVLVIDVGAGIHPSVLTFAAAAETVLITTTPEPTAMTDAYGLIKSLARRKSEARLRILINQAHTESEARDAFNRFDRVSRTFLARPLEYAGMIPEDRAVRQAVHQRTPFTLLAPQCPASRAMVRVVRRMIDHEAGPEPVKASTSPGFLSRLTRLLRR